MAQQEVAGAPGRVEPTTPAVPAARDPDGQPAGRPSTAGRRYDISRPGLGRTPMRRRLLNGLTFLSLLLCAVSAALWVRGYFVGDAVDWHRLSSDRDTTTKWVGSVHNGRGALAVATIARTIRNPAGGARRPVLERGTPKRGLHWAPGPPRRPSAPPEYGGFRAGFFESVSHTSTSRAGGVLSRGSAVTVSWWAPVALLAATPVVRGVRFVRRCRRDRRVRMGLCLHCGYDLRGSPGICPECGETSERVDSADGVRAPAPG